MQHLANLVRFIKTICTVVFKAAGASHDPDCNLLTVILDVDSVQVLIPLLFVKCVEFVEMFEMCEICSVYVSVVESFCSHMIRNLLKKEKAVESEDISFFAEYI